MNTSFLFNASAAIEILTGAALLVVPSLVNGLLLGDDLSSTGVAVAHMLAIGLLSVGVAGYESRGVDARLAPWAGLCINNVGAAVVRTSLHRWVKPAEYFFGPPSFCTD